MQAIEYTRVAQHEHPMLWGCLEEIAYDAGAMNRTDPNQELLWLVPKRFEPQFSAIEGALEELPMRDRITLCTGEEEEQKALASGSIWLSAAHSLFNEFFEGPMR